jgi:hypothetical protein
MSGKVTANPYDAPRYCPYAEMRRHWWIAFDWDLCDTIDKGPYFFIRAERAVADKVAAAKEFDMMRADYQAKKARDEYLKG